MSIQLTSKGLAAFLLLSTFSLPPSVWADDVPAAVNYQGRLSDNMGNPLASGYYHIEFRIWDDPLHTGSGDLIWGRMFPLHVMTGGVFTIVLTDDGGLLANPAPQIADIRDAFQGEDRYLGLTITQTPAGPVGTPAEISPRQRLVSAPYAFHAQHATSADTAAYAANASNAYHAADALAASSGFTVTGPFVANGAATLKNSLLVLGGTIVSNNLRVAGTLTVSSPSTFAGYGTIPIGGIILWSGSAAAIPDGWALCNGSVASGQTTPDLRDRFVVGAGSTNYPVGTMGGLASVTLTVEQMPSHTHKYFQGRFESFYGHGAYHNMWVDYDNGDWTDPTGGDQPHENRPPFYALCYIMRVK
jgi:hypothetical protein